MEPLEEVRGDVTFVRTDKDRVPEKDALLLEVWQVWSAYSTTWLLLLRVSMMIMIRLLSARALSFPGL